MMSRHYRWQNKVIKVTLAISVVALVLLVMMGGIGGGGGGGRRSRVDKREEVVGGEKEGVGVEQEVVIEKM